MLRRCSHTALVGFLRLTLFSSASFTPARDAAAAASGVAVSFRGCRGRREGGSFTSAMNRRDGVPLVGLLQQAAGAGRTFVLVYRMRTADGESMACSVPDTCTRYFGPRCQIKRRPLVKYFTRKVHQWTIFKTVVCCDVLSETISDTVVESLVLFRSNAKAFSGRTCRVSVT